MNLSKELKKKRDMEDRLRQTSPQKVFFPDGFIDLSQFANKNHTHEFLDLTDTPNNYVADKFIKVNAEGDGLEYGDGGGLAEIPQATEIEFGGIKAAEKTSGETQEVKIDPVTGKLYSTPPTSATNGIPSGGNAGQILSKIDTVDYNAGWTDFSVDVQEEFEYSSGGIGLVSLNKPYTKSALAGGSYQDTNNTELTDGIKGNTPYSDTSYSGYRNVNLSVVIDLQSLYNVSKCILYGIQATTMGIKTPTSVEFLTSTDNVNFTSVGNTVPTSDNAYTASIDFSPISARYVKCTITRGGEWTFISEFEVYGQTGTGVVTGYIIGGGVVIGANLPQPSESYRGKFFTLLNENYEDMTYVCHKKADGTYYWKLLS